MPETQLTYKTDETARFPECLLVSFNVDPTPRLLEMDGWRVGHNRAVTGWIKTRMGVVDGVSLTTGERSLLDLLDGIRSFVQAQDAGDPDYYTCQIVEHLTNGFHDALNLDLGRLDGGTLSGYLVRLVAPWVTL